MSDFDCNSFQCLLHSVLSAMQFQVLFSFIMLLSLHSFNNLKGG